MGQGGSLRIQVLWCVTLCHWGSRCQHFEGSHGTTHSATVSHLKSFESSTTLLWERHHILKDFVVRERS